MDLSDLPTQGTGRWRYLCGIGCMISTVALILLGYATFPHGSVMRDGWARSFHASVLLFMSGLGCLVAGAIFIGYELLRRRDQRVEASCPIDRRAYREALQRMMRQAEHHPHAPVDPKSLRQMLELLEPANVASRAGYVLTTTEE